MKATANRADTPENAPPKQGDRRPRQAAHPTLLAGNAGGLTRGAAIARVAARELRPELVKRGAWILRRACKAKDYALALKAADALYRWGGDVEESVSDAALDVTPRATPAQLEAMLAKVFALPQREEQTAQATSVDAHALSPCVDIAADGAREQPEDQGDKAPVIYRRARELDVERVIEQAGDPHPQRDWDSGD